MRNALGIMLITALGLGACNSGGQSETPPTGVAPPPLRPPPVSIGGYTNFDYLGPLAEAAVWTDDGRRLPLESCYGPSYSEPLAACVDNVMLDDFQASIGDLRAGQIVEIHGSRLATGLADRGEPIGNIDVEIKRAVVGPVEAIDVDRGWLTVLGQRVYASDSDMVAYTIGDVVNVYGHFTPGGQVVATRVEPYEGEPLFLLRGVLTEPAAGHLAIGSLELDISSASRENFPAGAPLAGDAVLVLANQAPENGILTADTIRCTGKCAAVTWTSNWEYGSVRGIVTGWRSYTDFDIDGRALSFYWCECAYASPVPLGSFVDVALYGGNADIITRAASTSHTIGVSGRISAVDAVYREVVVLGYRVQVSPATQITTAPVIYFAAESSVSFEDLRVGDWVDVSGEALGAGIRAGVIVRQNSGNTLKALQYTFDAPAILIAGRPVLTDGTTQVSVCRGGGSITLDQLFATASSEAGAWLSIAITDPYAEPLVAQEITVCQP